MKTQELRIGNYVEGIGMEDPIRRINDSIQYNYNTEKYELDAIDIQFFKPIPITEEWLEKFGFEKLTDSKDGFKVTSYTYTKGISFIVYFDGVRLSTNFWMGNEKHYVHQLQNLFYVLSGEELKLK